MKKNQKKEGKKIPLKQTAKIFQFLFVFLQFTVPVVN